MVASQMDENQQRLHYTAPDDRVARRSDSRSSYTEAGGDLLVCPICVKSRGLEGTTFVTNATVAGATPLWEWIGDEERRSSATETSAPGHPEG